MNISGAMRRLRGGGGRALSAVLLAVAALPAAHAAFTNGDFSQPERRFNQAPGRRPALAMQLDAMRHFAVERLRRRYVDDMQAALDGPFFRQRALTRARSADDQFFHGAKLSDCTPSRQAG